MSDKSDFYEYLKDADLGISTIGRVDKHSNDSKYPYEPTAYSVLDRLIGSGFISASDRVIDYGCGKGRVPIYLHDRIGCATIGIEVETDFYNDAVINLKDYAGMNREAVENINFIHIRAQAYEVPEDVTACFFFNPFSSDILKNVIPQIVKSAERSPHRIRLFFYYPSSAYIAYLSSVDRLMFIDEIDCTDLFPEEDDSRNRIMVYEIEPFFPLP